MSDRDDSLDAFTSALDAINDFCEARVHDRGEENACKDCVLNDYCLNIPSRESYKAAFMSVDKCMELIRRAKEEDLNMGKIRDDEPAYIFCNAETKKEIVKRSGADLPLGYVFVMADIIPYGFCVVTTKDEFLGWLFAKGNDHDIWTIPEESDDPNETI